MKLYIRIIMSLALLALLATPTLAAADQGGDRQAGQSSSTKVDGKTQNERMEAITKELINQIRRVIQQSTAHAQQNEDEQNGDGGNTDPNPCFESADQQNDSQESNNQQGKDLEDYPVRKVSLCGVDLTITLADGKPLPGTTVSKAIAFVAGRGDAANVVRSIVFQGGRPQEIGPNASGNENAGLKNAGRNNNSLNSIISGIVKGPVKILGRIVLPKIEFRDLVFVPEEWNNLDMSLRTQILEKGDTDRRYANVEEDHDGLPKADTYCELLQGASEAGQDGHPNATKYVDVSEKERLFIVTSTNFMRPLEFHDTSICGKLDIEDSRLAALMYGRTFTYVKGEQYLAKDHVLDEKSGTWYKDVRHVIGGFSIKNNKFHGPLRLQAITIDGPAFVHHNNGSEAHPDFADVDLMADAMFTDNNFREILVDRTILRCRVKNMPNDKPCKFTFRSNAIGAGGIKLTNIRVPPRSGENLGEQLQINNNKVTGAFEISFADLGLSDDKRLDLSHNRVFGPVRILFPKNTFGIGKNSGGETADSDTSIYVDLSGFRSRNQFSLSLARDGDDEQRSGQICKEVDQDCVQDNENVDWDEILYEYCSEKIKNDEENGESNRKLTFNFSLAKFSALSWNLPLGASDPCQYGWHASSLDFEDWGPAEIGNLTDAADSDGSRSNPVQNHLPLSKWRYLMVNEGGRAHALTEIADHLAAHGDVVESRNVRQEVLKENFCGRDGCRAQFGAWFDDAAELLSGSEGMLRAGFGMLLAPVGYGAKPEKALIWFVIVLLISWFIYRLYAALYDRPWKRKKKIGSANPDGDEGADGTKLGTRSGDEAKENQSLYEKGQSRVPGFMQFDTERLPQEFSLFIYSMDALIPVINLHAYDCYYPTKRFMRWLPSLQNVLGWYLATILTIAGVLNLR